MSTSYYKITDQVVVAAFTDFEKQKKQLIEQANKLATFFDGKPIFSSDMHSMRLYGIELTNFESRSDKWFWTKPQRNRKYASKPRAKAPKAADRSEFNSILTSWKELLPESISREDIFASIGCSWGDFFFNGLSVFSHNEVVYIATAVKITKGVEILGSEFSAVKELAA
ncbi:hypothetical protein Sps_05159 [Shewanella psychrophila]|uniref:Uncharacterized protein n=1 Tax=Shewanella psychrophila TaxID=225848 RepID=A0A1S6HXT4_9GAMM|nr:hypothetical protein [Shewanella psychrophila]AQS40228.1 hypothetical protein Sps_05159 [Shewanella psychrophila]